MAHPHLRAFALTVLYAWTALPQVSHSPPLISFKPLLQYQQLSEAFLDSPVKTLYTLPCFPSLSLASSLASMF